MNDVSINVSEIIAEFIRRAELAMDSLIILEMKKGAGIKSANEWRGSMMNQLPQFRKKLDKLAADVMNKIPSMVRKAVYLNYKYSGESEQSYQKAFDMLKDVDSVRVPSIIVETSNKLIAELQNSIKLMVGQKMLSFQRGVGMVYQKSIITTQPAKTIYEEVLKRTTSILDSKRVVSPLQGNLQTRKSIELAVRRSMQEVTVQAVDSSGPVFILCSSHGNSAPDHAEHQGKVYFHENWKNNAPESLHDRIQKIIAKKGMKSYQWVQNEPVKMWVRWNCTHKQMQVPIDEVESMNYSELLAKYNFKTNGSYDRKKYKAQMKQRYMERQRRKFDEKLTILKNTKTGTPDQEKMLKLKYDEWGKKLTRHLSSHSLYLSRQREREKAKTLMFDFGVKLQFKE